MTRNFIRITSMTCRHILLSALLVALSTETHAQNDSSDWQLVWADEFNSAEKPAESSWNYNNGLVLDGGPQWYRSDNVYCEDGKLVLKAYRGRIDNPDYNPDSKLWSDLRKWVYWTSGSVDTKNKHEMLYGRLEVRVKLSSTGGSWPAISLLSGDYSPVKGTASARISLMENYGRCLHSGVSWIDADGKLQTDMQRMPLSDVTEYVPGWYDEYHVIRLDWDSAEVKSYIDGKLISSSNISRFMHVKNGEAASPFHAPMYLMLNLALRTEDGIDDADMPSLYYIDYVRYYKRTAKQGLHKHKKSRR